MRLIDANSAKSSILVVANCIPIDSDWLNGYKTGLIAATEAIDEIPTIETEPVKHGDWYGCGNMWMCTECNDLAYVMHNYCPNCGAKMDGDSNA